MTQVRGKHGVSRSRPLTLLRLAVPSWYDVCNTVVQWRPRASPRDDLQLYRGRCLMIAEAKDRVLLLTSYLHEMEKVRGLAENTLAAYRRDLAILEEFLDEHFDADDWTWADVNRSAIRAWIKGFDTEGVATVRRRVSVARSFFHWLQREGAVERDPIGKLKMRRRKWVPRALSRTATEKGFHQLTRRARRAMPVTDADRLKPVRDLAICETLYGAGLRLRELTKLDICDLDFSEGLLRVRHGKGGKDRVVPARSRRDRRDPGVSPRPQASRR